MNRIILHILSIGIFTQAMAQSIKENSNKNISDTQTGIISGYIFESDSTTKIPGMYGYIFDKDNLVKYTFHSDGKGYYCKTGIEPGEYHLMTGGFFGEDYIVQFYNSHLFMEDADALTISEGDSLSNINFYLQRGGVIQGHVFESDSITPIAGMDLTITCSFCENLEYNPMSDVTDSSGKYTLNRIPTGEYSLYASGISCQIQKYTPQYYMNSENVSNATLLSVTAPDTLKNINFYMQGPGSITGFVFETDSITPIKYVYVQAEYQGVGFGSPNIAFTDSLGYYSFYNLAPGEYKVSSCGLVNKPVEKQAYLNNYYKNYPSDINGSIIHVDNNATTENINLYLDRGGFIEGYIFNSDSTRIIKNARVMIKYATMGMEIYCQYSDESGHYYSMSPLQYQDYFIYASGCLSDGTCPYEKIYYDNARTIEQADTIHILTSDTLTINFYLTLKDEFLETVPKAEFDADLQSGINPLTVQFADLSTGSISSWLWDFGDGNTSNYQNPTHVYENTDSFSVKLTVEGPTGLDTTKKDNYIIVNNLSKIENNNIPLDFNLYSIYPNPFNPISSITFSIPHKSDVYIYIYDISGRMINILYKGEFNTGIHKIVWDASSLPSGTYFIKFVAGDYTKVRKCVLIK